MITTLTATNFLPTDASPFSYPLVIAGLVVAGVLLITLLVGQDNLSSGGVMCAYFIISVSAIGALGGGIATATAANETNLIENVKTVYEIDKLVFDEKVQPDAQKSIAVTVVADGKAFKAVLTNDEKTYEPTLSIFESSVNTDFDIESLKK